MACANPPWPLCPCVMAWSWCWNSSLPACCFSVLSEVVICARRIMWVTLLLGTLRLGDSHCVGCTFSKVRYPNVKDGRCERLAGAIVLRCDLSVLAGDHQQQEVLSSPHAASEALAGRGCGAHFQTCAEVQDQTPTVGGQTQANHIATGQNRRRGTSTCVICAYVPGAGSVRRSAPVAGRTSARKRWWRRRWGNGR